MHTFGNQSTRRQKRQKMSHNRNQNALESTKNLQRTCCYVTGMLQHVQGIKWWELLNLHITARLFSTCWSSKKCEWGSFPMRHFTSLSFSLLSLLQAHLFQELPHIVFCFFIKSYSQNTFGCWRLHTLVKHLDWLLHALTNKETSSHTTSIQTHCRSLTPNK